MDKLEKITEEQLQTMELKDILNNAFNIIDQRDAYFINKIESIERSIKALTDDISSLKTDISSLKTDVPSLKTDVYWLRNDLTLLLNHFGLKSGQQILNENKPAD